MFKITYYYLLRNKLIAALMLAALTITFYFPIFYCKAYEEAHCKAGRSYNG